jgi:L-asparaginase II
MSIGNHMQLWRELADEQKNQRVTLLKKLWLESPELTGGSARLDTALMLADRGNVLAKEGADGLLMVQSLPRPGHVPQGCFIKVSSGYSTAHLALALWAKLTKEKSQLNASFQLIYQYLDQHKLRWFPMDQELVLL